MTEEKAAGRTLLRKIASQRHLFLMATPLVVLMVMFCYAPMFGVLTAFERNQPAMGFFRSKFVGLDSFRTFLGTAMLPLILRNTLGISLLKLLIVFPSGIIFALLLNEIAGSLVKRVVQTISYLPYFISWVVVIGIWGKLLSADGGLINAVLAALHVEPVAFISQAWFMWPFAVLSEMWKETGWNAIIFLAALSAIDPALYEAARVDGANRWNQMWHITLPGIGNVIAIMLVLSVPGIIGSNTDQMWVLGKLPVREATEVIDTYVLRIGIGGAQYGLAAAISLMRSVVSFFLLYGANQLAKRFSDSGAVL
jgi:putative aldouronate transport system permease protein